MTDRPPAATPACPICGKPRAAAFRPFCSRRCADVDLAKWFRGDYAVPTDEPAPDAEPAPDTKSAPPREG